MASRLTEAFRAVHDEVRDRTRDDLVEASKALYDSLSGRIDAKAIETEIQVKELKARVERQEADLLSWLQERVSEAVAARTQSLADEYQAQLRAIAEASERAAERMEAIVRGHLGQIEALLSRLSLPAPQVTVSVPEQPSPVVNVQVPETPVTVSMAAPVVNVEGPRVMVPEQPAPVIHVEVPRRAVVKDIQYDEFNRPSRIKETEE